MSESSGTRETRETKSAGRTRFLASAAVIGAVYAALTFAGAGIGYGPVQLRVSEALTILPYFTPAAIPGLFVGCLVSNLISPVGPADVVCGSLATLLAAALSRLLRSRRVLVPLPPVLVNAVVIGAMLYYAYGVNASLALNMLSVGAGQLAACYGLGYPLMRLLERHRRLFG